MFGDSIGDAEEFQHLRFFPGVEIITGSKVVLGLQVKKPRTDRD